MGVDLRLMPLLHQESEAAHDMFNLGGDYELWAEINKLPQVEIKGPIWSFVATAEDGETTYGKTEKDPYGNRLKTVTAGNLASLRKHPNVQDNWRTKAAWAYLAEMPADWPIVLYWH